MRLQLDYARQEIAGKQCRIVCLTGEQKQVTDRLSAYLRMGYKIMPGSGTYPGAKPASVQAYIRL